jgi:hypothetical protein
LTWNTHLKKELRIKAEEKYEPINMTISTQNEFICNNETRLDSLNTKLKMICFICMTQIDIDFIMVSIGLKLLSIMQTQKHLRIKGMVRFNLINIST